MWPFGSRKDASAEDAKSLEALAEFFAAANGTASKIAVSPSKALECAPVARAVAVRSETLGVLPLHLYSRLEDGGKERADHPLADLMSNRPNGWTSAPQFLMELERDTLMNDAGAFAVANRVDGGRVHELIRLKPDTVTVETDFSGEPRYLVSQKGGGQRTYPWRDILHIPNIGGVCAIKQAREAIGLCMAMQGHAARIFANGGRPSGILKSPKKISEPVIARLKESWNKAHTGEASGGTAILEEGMDFSALTFNSVDLQFHELRGFQVVEIARALGVPPTLIFDLGRATWANAAEMAQAFLTFTLLARLRLWCGAVSRLLTAEEQKTLVPEFVVDGIVMADIEKRFAAYASAISSRVFCPNEVRQMENRPPYAGGDKFENPNTTSGSAENSAQQQEDAA
ncbi:phage portal protein [Bosea rubneri]|uniref:Phage portal protein n=1 Tax=Bosea rubneri TaxID=3075434 RepID=A0ABU3S464_9HYPH|nr:phage portal protein [Bosea sp. ZW T0_25]MDU0339579.1 phage portal protein [Bosea sp. ZW T0_25]